jgi:hypothetical protein
VIEGDAGAVMATFTVTRSGGTGGPASVTWSTADVTAVDGADYVAVVGAALSFDPGDTAKTVRWR